MAAYFTDEQVERWWPGADPADINRQVEHLLTAMKAEADGTDPIALDGRPKSPFYLVWNESGREPRHKHATFPSALAEAERLAKELIGPFHVLAVVATARMTELKTEQFAFDPDHSPKKHPSDCECDDCQIPF